MAQLILTAATNAAQAVGRAGIGQALARTAASSIANFAASSVSSLIFGPTRRRVEGPRLESFQVQASTEGAAVLRVYGRARLSGQVIWAANFKETIAEDVQGGKGNRLGTQTTSVSYIYSISLAIGLCEGEIARIGRVWADGKPFDQSQRNIRVYQGSEEQTPDPLIEIHAGTDNAPAFRGLAYVVFEDLVLTDFGNRIPQFSFEVERPLHDETGSDLETQIAGVTIIPSSGEFVYATTPVSRILAPGAYVTENSNNNQGATDFTVSMDALQGSLPNVQHAALVVAWFGSDLRVGECMLRPGVESSDKQTIPYEWHVSGTTRADAYLISQQEGRPSYGGTPSDNCVLEAIGDMISRGLQVMFHPFILMDIAPSTNLPSPSGSGMQPAFPWRGRIEAGNFDGTASAHEAVASFFGAAAISDFTQHTDGISYTGPSEHSLRRMILHYAHLCKLAQIRFGKPIEAFLLASELRGITTIRDDLGNYPAVAHLRTLAADVRAILGPDVAISYGADWSEYSGHQPEDNSGTRMFHLDQLWADSAIDFIGIDNYMPLSDWRPGFGHLDQIADPANGPYARDYLQSNIQGGEGYAWFYANATDREQQIRTPIIDGAHGEDWVFRVKDLWNWWANAHHDRPNGARATTPTAWIPQSKPFRFTEIGCPAVDNGAAQPNVFVDPKSAESALPYFSRASRDDLAQRRFLEAHLSFWRDQQNNPLSALYQGSMVDTDRHYVYAWDARPFPDFPARHTVWGDTENWTLGHWLNGRVGRAPLDLLVEALAGEVNFDRIDTSQLDGVITGYVIDRPLSPREMIDPLADVFQFDMVEAGGRLRFQPRYATYGSGSPLVTLSNNDLIADATGNAAFSRITGQSNDLPSAFRLGFLDEGADLTASVAAARDPGLRSAREESRQVAAVLPMEEAQARARSILADAWVMRERISFSLAPTLLSLEPGDLVTFTDDDVARDYRITEIEDGATRQLHLVRLSASVYEAPSGSVVFRPPAAVSRADVPVAWHLLDLPLLDDDEPLGAPRFSATARPWPGEVLVYRQSTDDGGGLRTLAGQSSVPGMIGTLASALPSALAGAPSGRWITQSIDISLANETLVSRTMLEVLGGANALAVRAPDGNWEVLQFLSADIIAPDRWRVSGLLRGQAGSEAQAVLGAEIGAPVIFLNGARRPQSLAISLDSLGIDYVWRAGPGAIAPDHASFTAQSFTPTGRNLRPLSPVHLRARQSADGALISWIRRTRRGGDRWEGEDVPLGEAREAYRLIVTGDGQTIRTVELTGPNWLYPVSLITQDRANLPLGASLMVTVVQQSDLVGSGDPSFALIL